MAIDLATRLRDLCLDDYRDYLLAIARPCVELITADAAVSAGCSKLGGVPDLPADFTWPYHLYGPYRFIGQVNFAEMPAPPDGLSNSGVLSFFYAHDEDGEVFWGEPDYVRVYHFDEAHRLEATEPPVAVRPGATTRVRLEAGSDVPPWPWTESDTERWPIPASARDAYWDLRLRLHPSRRYLFGYPLNTTLAYDPTPGPEWRSLLTLASDDELHWCWHDGDWLVTFVEEQRLLRGDYSRIKADAG